jgi:hypothetical protein
VLAVELDMYLSNNTQHMQNADNTAIKHQVIGRPFPKGVSGNPNGRPKGSFSIKDKIRQHLEEHPEEVTEIIKYFVTENRELMWQMLEGSPRSSSNIKVEECEVIEPPEDELLLARQLLELRKRKSETNLI